jgi:glycosyltransferase involved in cell wall biosynthesis
MNSGTTASRPLHIVMVPGLRSTKFGAFEHFILDVVRQCEDRGHRVSLLWEAVPTSDAFNRDLATTKAENLVMPAGGRFGRFLWKVYRWFRKHRPDVVHTHFDPASLPALLAARLARIAVPMLTIHSCPDLAGKGLGWRSRKVLRSRIGLARKVFCVSENVMNAYLPFGVDAGQMDVLYLGVSPESTATAMRQEMRAKLGLSDDQPVLVTTAFHHPAKGNDVLLRALAILVRRYPDVKLVQIGGESQPGQTSALKELGQLLGIDDHVLWMGLRNDVNSLLMAGDVYCQPSRSEGLPLAILEAAQAGLPIVASNVGGIPEVVVDGKNGILVEPDNPEVLARGLETILTQPHLHDAMAAASRELLASTFNLQAQTEELVNQYEQLWAQQAGEKA